MELLLYFSVALNVVLTAWGTHQWTRAHQKRRKLLVLREDRHEAMVVSSHAQKKLEETMSLLHQAHEELVDAQRDIDELLLEDHTL